MAVSPCGQSSLVHSLAALLRENGDVVLDGTSTLTLPPAGLQQLTRLFEQHLLPRGQQHGFLALPSHPADTASLLELQFLFDILQKTVSLKLVNPLGERLQCPVKIFPFKSLRCLELKRIPPHLLEGLRGVYSQLEVFICSKSLGSPEELLSLCGGDLSSALPWLELHTLNFSYNSIICLDQSLSLLNVLKFLDLSHNKIQECAEFLKPLSELQHLNLGYNCLQGAPALSPSSRSKLHTLILRNNELETINGVEQLCSLRHLDLSYNLLLEHSQLAPLSMLHSLSMLNLEGNPLFFQQSHRTTTVRHLSPKAASLKFRLDGILLSSYELSVLPKGGHMVVTATPPPIAPQESQEVSSGPGELSDSVSVGEAVVVSRLRKRKSRSKVKVRRASISEPSDTDYEPIASASTKALDLPHKEEIERMSSFREQLGEDWLRYQHHLDGALPPNSSAGDNPDHLTNGISATPPAELPVVLPPPLLSSETKEPEQEAEVETDSTIQWLSQSHPNTESTLEGSGKQEAEGSSRSGSLTLPNQEDEEDLGVELCHPLLVGVSTLIEKRENQEGGDTNLQVFLCVKQRFVLEVDIQSGQERGRLELDCLIGVDTKETMWIQGDSEQLLPAVLLHFDYISEAKRQRLYVLLDDHPQQAAQTLIEVLSRVVEENNKRNSAPELRPTRLQCLRCRTDFLPQADEAGGRRRGGEPFETEAGDELTGKPPICPECGSDHVVQVAEHSAPYSSTPVNASSRPDLQDDHLDLTHGSYSAIKDDGTDGSYSSSPAPDAPAPFVTARGSSFFIGDGPGDTSSLSSTADGCGKDELAGSYHYTASGTTPHVAPPASRSPPKDELDLLSEDFEVVDHRLKLFLDVEVFEEEDEDLHSYLKMSAVKFGEPGEVPSLLVVSNHRMYFLEVTSDDEGQLTDWLRKKDSHSLLDLSYLEVGLGSQSIHMEFGDGGAAYTLLVRDSARCKRFFGLLTGIVREMAHKPNSKLRSISTTRLSAQHHLWPLVCEDIQADVEDGQLQFFYALAFVLQGDVWTPQTVLATRETLYLLREHHQWRRSGAAATEADSNSVMMKFPLDGHFTITETLPISCVSAVVLWPSERQRRMDVKLYDETEKREKTWCVRAESAELLQGLLAWVRTQWEAMFGVKLNTTLREEDT